MTTLWIPFIASEQILTYLSNLFKCESKFTNEEKLFRGTRDGPLKALSISTKWPRRQPFLTFNFCQSVTRIHGITSLWLVESDGKARMASWSKYSLQMNEIYLKLLAQQNSGPTDLIGRRLYMQRTSTNANMNYPTSRFLGSRGFVVAKRTVW